MKRMTNWAAKAGMLLLPGPLLANTASAQSNPGIDPTLLVIGVGIGAAVGAFGGFYAARKRRGRKKGR
jgi:hypothetical protein